MSTNEGLTDRMLRVILGATLIGLTLAGPIGLWGWIGIVPLVTGLTGMCPIYALFGIDTGRLRSQ